MDADEVVGKLLERKSVLKRIKKVFGGRVFGRGERLIREKVSDIIFKDSALRHSLEDILHPLVFREIDRLLKGKKGIAVVEAPVLFERGYEKRFNKTITVYTDEETALRRLQAGGMKKGAALERLAAQMPIKDKIKRSDYKIDNSQGMEETEKQVKRIYKRLLMIEGA